MFGLSSREESRSTRSPRGDLRPKESCRVGKRELEHLFGIAARTATFRLRVARSGGEVRQLAVWQPRPRVPAGARAAVPVCPSPVTGASWIRDNTPGRTS